MDWNTIITLFIAELLGMLAHGFKESYKRNKAQEPKYNIFNYFKDEVNSVCFVVICCFVAAYYSEGVKHIKECPGYVTGPLYFALAYMGDSAFPSILDAMGNFISMLTEKFKGGKKDNPQP